MARKQPEPNPRKELEEDLRAALGDRTPLIDACLSYAEGARKERLTRRPKERRHVAARRWASRVRDLASQLRAELDVTRSTAPPLRFVRPRFPRPDGSRPHANRTHVTQLDFIIEFVNASSAEMQNLTAALLLIEQCCQTWATPAPRNRPRNRDDEQLAWHLETLFRLHGLPVFEKRIKKHRGTPRDILIVSRPFVDSFFSIKSYRDGKVRTSRDVSRDAAAKYLSRYLAGRQGWNIVDHLRQNNAHST